MTEEINTSTITTSTVEVTVEEAIKKEEKLETTPINSLVDMKKLIKTSSLSPHIVEKYIKVRTEFEGYHRYPTASDVDERIAFLEQSHRHMFKVEVKILVFDEDRELEFFLVKWALQEFIKNTFTKPSNLSCEMMSSVILYKHLLPTYGENRRYEVVVSEDGESDGIVLYDANCYRQKVHM